MNGAELPLWVTVPGTLLLVTGGLLALIGGIGLLRFPTFFMRMHPPTMGASLGTGCVLVASMLVSSALVERPVVHELLITVLLIVTAPVTAMLLMRAGVYRQRVDDARNSRRRGTELQSVDSVPGKAPGTPAGGSH